METNEGLVDLYFLISIRFQKQIFSSISRSPKIRIVQVILFCCFASYYCRTCQLLSSVQVDSSTQFTAAFLVTSGSLCNPDM